MRAGPPDMHATPQDQHQVTRTIYTSQPRRPRTMNSPCSNYSTHVASAAQLAPFAALGLLDDPTGQNCSHAFKHICFGHPRAGENAHSVAFNEARQIYTWANSSPGQDDFFDLVRFIVSTPTCTLSFVGDSLSLDSWTAAFGELLVRPGYELLECHSNDVHERRFGCPQMINPFNTRSARFSLPRHALSSLCNAISIDFYASYADRRPPGMNATEVAFAVLNASSLTILNVGVHANANNTLLALYDEEARPYLQVNQDLFASRRLLWRETLPQHFDSVSGDGGGV